MQTLIHEKETDARIGMLHPSSNTSIKVITTGSQKDSRVFEK